MSRRERRIELRDRRRVLRAAYEDAQQRKTKERRREEAAAAEKAVQERRAAARAAESAWWAARREEAAAAKLQARLSEQVQQGLEAALRGLSLVEYQELRAAQADLIRVLRLREQDLRVEAHRAAEQEWRTRRAALRERLRSELAAVAKAAETHGDKAIVVIPSLRLAPAILLGGLAPKYVYTLQELLAVEATGRENGFQP